MQVTILRSALQMIFIDHQYKTMTENLDHGLYSLGTSYEFIKTV